MLDAPNSVYTFNHTDYDFVVALTNGVNKIFLRPESWDNLTIEEDIFDWRTMGSIDIHASYESLERESAEAVILFGDKTKMIYKFRNDGRDTIYFYMFPKNNGPLPEKLQFDKDKWTMELECVIYDVEDFQSTNITNKIKRLYFWDKSYQMMLEKNIEFTSANVGDNKGNTNIHHLNNDKRSLMTGQLLGELILNDEDFGKHGNLYADGDPEFWNMGDPKNKIMYTSPTNYRFVDDMNYILQQHTSIESEDFQPCIFKLERPEEKGKPRQFSLKSINEYFKKAGKSTPGEYLIEKFILEEYNMDSKNNVPIIKVPDHTTASLDPNKNLTAEDYSNIKKYQIVDFSGLDNSNRLYNRYITSLNLEKGQWNIEIKDHKTEKYQEFFKKNIVPNIMTNNDEDRLPLTNFVKKGYNAMYHYSEYETPENRFTDGRNKLLNYYIFSNLGITFSTRGLLIRQPGRFFSVTKNTRNIAEYDHKLEGQYFITNVRHYFSPKARSYFTQLTGIKMHTFVEETKLPDDDIIIIGG